MKKYQNTLLGYGHGEHTEMWEEKAPPSLPPKEPKKDWIAEAILFVLFTALSILVLKILSNL